MLGFSPSLKVFVASEPVSMRLSFDGLRAWAETTLHKNPFGEHLFVFFNRKRDKVKLLYWDRNGFCLWYKRLEQGRFPKLRVDKACYRMRMAELNLLLEGIDLCDGRRLRMI